MKDTDQRDPVPDNMETVDPDLYDHPWIDEMRQYEPIDEVVKEAEAWFS